MCGIAGVIDTKGSLATVDTIQRMNRCIQHRGPDDTGVWTDRPVALGHTRLSIIDLSPNGHQPMSDTTGRFTIVFNGEIYNYQTLRNNLVKQGYQFRSQTDTEVLLAMYAEYGPSCVTQLEGMWALAIYDQAKQVLWCSRDRFGKKPFYYYLTNHSFIFASQPQAIRAALPHSLSIDQTALAYYLTFGYIPDPLSIWLGIQKLPPAHNLLIDIQHLGQNKPEPYWSTDQWLQPNSQRSTTQLDAEIQSTFQQAVQRRLVGDVPIGAFLSGGIDSSAVVASMRQALPATTPLHTFSIGFDHARYDETAYAHQVAEKLGTIHHVKTLTANEALTIFNTLPHYYDEPFADSSMIPTYAVSQLARQYVTVALSGDGGDELWGGYLNYVMFAYVQQIKQLLPMSTYPLIRQGAFVLSRLLRTAQRNPGLALGLLTLQWINASPSELFARLSSLHVEIDRSTYSLFQPYFKYSQWANNVMQAYLNTHLPYDFLVKVDRASMAHGLEVRCPFLDTDFVRLALSVPADEKIWVHQTRYKLKHALRRAFANSLPATVIQRGKQGFSLPMAEYLINEWRPLLKEKLAAIGERQLLPINRQDIQKILAAHTKRYADYSQFLYALVNLETWLEHWNL